MRSRAEQKQQVLQMKYPIYGVWGICTLLILCLACQNEEPSAQHSTPPNILFITVDDLRPQLGAYGHEYMVTPHMDRLAKNGRLFANHYVIVPTCGPSRYTMLTGQYPVTRAELRNDILDRKSTRLNSSHVRISYAVFCLKKKKKKT